MKSLAAMNAEDTIAHLRNDMEIMRSGVVRRLKSDLMLLKEAQEANSKTPPKTHVVDDHLDRVIESLEKEVKKLTELPIR